MEPLKHKFQQTIPAYLQVVPHIVEVKKSTTDKALVIRNKDQTETDALCKNLKQTQTKL